jgi:hypothetical protein
VVVRPVAEREVGGREDSEAREEIRETERREFEEVKEPVIAFESQMDNRASPEPSKAEDYMDEDDITYDNAKARTSKIASDRAIHEEPGQLAEAHRKGPEAAAVS